MNEDWPCPECGRPALVIVYATGRGRCAWCHADVHVRVVADCGELITVMAVMQEGDEVKIKEARRTAGKVRCVAIADLFVPRHDNLLHPPPANESKPAH